jgi:hypothetical protein
MTVRIGKLQRKRPLFRFLDTLGNGLGIKDAVGNYASADTAFFIETTDPHERYIIHRIMTYIEDAGGSPNLSLYGGRPALTDGILLRVVHRDDNVPHDLSDGLPITRNSDWARICFDVTIATFPAGNNYVHARWTFALSGWPIVLNPFDRLEFVMRDNMTNLAVHSFLVQGYIE